MAQLRALCPKATQVAAVVKANAYGHGLAEVVPVLERHVDAFQVDDLDELIALRRITGKRALLFGFVPGDEIEEALSLGCELSLFDFWQVEIVARAARTLGIRAKAHFKVDALLGRLGVLPCDVRRLVDAVKAHPEIEVVSAYAHYANIEDTLDPSHAIRQEAAFASAFAEIRQALGGLGRHLSATSGLLARESPASPNNMVRLGIGLYGLYPSRPLAQSHADLDLRPALRWTSRLVQVKTLPPVHPVGYGLGYVTTRETTIGVVPQGYADGFDRGLSNRGEVLVGGRRCPVVGRVAMNMFMIDLQAAPDAKAEAEVVLLGRQGDEFVSAEEMAGRADTINYEVVARLNPLLPRRVVAE